MELIWKSIFVVVFVALFIIRLPYASMHKKADKKTSERPKVEKSLVFLNFITMMIIPMLVVFSPWFDGYRMNLPTWARIVSAVIFAANAILFFWVHKWLGRNWSPILEIKEEHKLITGGPYKFVRHPMYTQIWVWVIFQGLVLSNWALWISGIVAWAILFFIRVPREEQMMIAEFGTQYKEYKKRTGCILPSNPLKK